MRKLHKSSTSKVIFGVCGGLGETLNIDPVLLRIIFLVGVLCGLDFFLIIYLVLAICMPRE